MSHGPAFDVSANIVAFDVVFRLRAHAESIERGFEAAFILEVAFTPWIEVFGLMPEVLRVVV